jgi:mandelate racemase
MRDFDRRFRLLGWQGLVGMAVGGLDLAFWDALAKAADQPLAMLLGGTPKPLIAYDSYGVVDPKADEKPIARSLEKGFRGLKIKIGDGDLNRDVETVAAVRRFIGPDIALMVDYNQSLDPVEACRRLERLEEFEIHWVEEPVAAEDLAGHAQVRARSSIPLQTGENWWFPRDMAKAIAAGASDYAMLDVMKIGGVTGWLTAMGQAQAASMPVSSHLFIEASAHLLAVTPTAHWLERLDVASAILSQPSEVVDGRISAKGPGLGLDWDEKAVARYAQS